MPSAAAASVATCKRLQVIWSRESAPKNERVGQARRVAFTAGGRRPGDGDVRERLPASTG